MPDIERLEAVLEHIALHPEDHNQAKWTCGTAACFAGWTVRLFGPEEGFTQTRQYTDGNGWFGDQEWTETSSEEPITLDIPHLAIKLLGLTKPDANTLFDSDNTLPMLQSMVKDLANTGETRSWVHYQGEDIARRIEEKARG